MRFKFWNICTGKMISAENLIDTLAAILKEHPETEASNWTVHRDSDGKVTQIYRPVNDGTKAIRYLSTDCMVADYSIFIKKPVNNHG